MIVLQTIGALVGLVASAYLIRLGAKTAGSCFSSENSYYERPDYKLLIAGFVVLLSGVILMAIALTIVPSNLYSRLVIIAIGIIVTIIAVYQTKTDEQEQNGRSFKWSYIALYAVLNSFYLIILESADIIMFVKNLF